MQIKVINEVKVYEVDNEELAVGKYPKLKIKSHWNRSSFVILEFEGKDITVVASSLAKAIQNATNA